MLSGRLNGAASRNAILVVSLAIVGLGAIAAVATSSYLDMTSEIAEKSGIIKEQELIIQGYDTAVGTQKSEIESKSAELAQLQEKLSIVSQQLSAKENALEAESAEATELEADLQVLMEEATLLKVEISALQSKIQSDEQRIEELTLQKARSDRITVTHYGLGVDPDNKGTVFPIKVEIISSGTGILSVDINNVQYEPGFQTAVRSAAIAASQYSGEGISDKDIIVRFAPDGTISGTELIKVDGSSAGAIIAAMIAAGLSDRDIDSSVLVTGSISEDGTIGRVGSVEAKAVAAEDFGAEYMLVPESQEFQSETITVIGVSDINEVMDRLTTK